MAGAKLNVDAAGGLLHAEEMANVRPLRPIRVLLAGGDAHYLRAMAFLFQEGGYATATSLKPASLLADVDTFQPDVVVLVEGKSFGDAVGQAMALITRSGRLNAIVVTSRADAPDSSHLRFVAKEGSFAELAAAVDRAWAELSPG